MEPGFAWHGGISCLGEEAMQRPGTSGGSGRERGYGRTSMVAAGKLASSTTRGAATRSARKRGSNALEVRRASVAATSATHAATCKDVQPDVGAGAGAGAVSLHQIANTKHCVTM